MSNLEESMAVYGGLSPKRRSRRQTTESLRKLLQGRCVSAFIFGSMARNEHTARSDLDLCVIANTSRKFVERFRDFQDIVRLFSPIDLVIYTPQEVSELQQRPTYFWLEISKSKWTVISEANEKVAKSALRSKRRA